MAIGNCICDLSFFVDLPYMRSSPVFVYIVAVILIALWALCSMQKNFSACKRVTKVKPLCTMCLLLLIDSHLLLSGWFAACQGHPRFCFPPYSSSPCLMPVPFPGRFFISSSFCVAATTRVMLYRPILLAVTRVLMLVLFTLLSTMFFSDPFPSSCMLCGVGPVFLFSVFDKNDYLACQFISMLYTFQKRQLSPLLFQ